MTVASTPNLDTHPLPRDTPARTSANALSRGKLDTHGRLPRLTLEVHVTSTTRSRMIDTLVADYRAKHPPVDAVDLTPPPPPATQHVQVERGEVQRTRIDGTRETIGHVDKADRTGRATSTWRGVAPTGEVLTTGHRTRTTAVAALLTALHINPTEVES